ncbi:MAG: hypothetical protein QOD66_3418 [Solirubrobacteraceae bacterium]|nr:hypothetical protein [Solirubrobacteraceae bacterium]
MPVGAMAMLAFVAATNRWVSWGDAVHRYHDADPISYRAIAAAAPGLLQRRIAEWHAERFIPNYLVGCVAKLLHVGLVPTFRVASVVVAVAICLVLAALLNRLPISPLGALVCLGAFILNPYGLRYFFFGVGRVADLVFIFGAVLAVRGLARRAWVSLFMGLMVATAARQTALPAALTAGAVIVADPTWGPKLERMKLAVSMVVGPTLAYVLIRIVAAPFSGPSPSLHAMTILGAGGLNALLDHFARSAISLLSVTALLAAMWWTSSGRGHAAADRMKTDPAVANQLAALGSLLFGASIALQPVVLNPAWAEDSEPRLAVLGLAPLVVALALLFGRLELKRRAQVPTGAVAALLGLLAIGSFHHIFTLAGPGGKGQTVVLQGVVALALGAIILRIGPTRRQVPVAEPTLTQTRPPV